MEAYRVTFQLFVKMNNFLHQFIAVSVWTKKKATKLA